MLSNWIDHFHHLIRILQFVVSANWWFKKKSQVEVLTCRQMSSNVKTMKGIRIVVSSLVIAGAIQVGAQDQTYYPSSAPPPAPSGQVLAGNQLDQLLGPIALYPDPLIAQILAASSQPSQIAVAANYVNSGGDPNQLDAQPWDSSVKAVAHDPQILQLLDGNLQWTAELGQAFENQATDVMNSIQRLRAEATQEGNLQTTPQETVENDDGTIEIVPTNPDMLYVPEYDPSVVYYQPGVRLGWGAGFAIGPWFDFDFDWGHHRFVEWGRDHPRPSGWWHERPQQRNVEIGRAQEWRPSARAAAPRQFFSTASRGDRGYAPARETVPARGGERPALAPRENQPAPVQRGGERPALAPRESQPAPPPERQARPAPAPERAAPAPERPAQTRSAPARSAPSVFGGQSPSEARSSSSRGAESRGVSHPPSGGGGGGASRPSQGGGGNDKKH
jgi:Protein of unknown function (DUF3300)